MPTDTYFWHYVIHSIAKTLEVYDIRYRWQTYVSLCVRVWKGRIRKHDEIKKCEITRKN